MTCARNIVGALYPGRPVNGSLAGVRKGRVLAIGGGSQMGGGNPNGEFGTIDIPGVLGGPSNAIPAGVTYVKNGVAQVAYPAVHGITPGLIEYLRARGLATGLVVIERIVDGTGTQDWLDTHFATLVSDCTTAGVTPCMFLSAIGGQDTLSASVVNGLEGRLLQLAGRVEAAWPGAGMLESGLMSTDTVSFPQQAASRTIGARVMNDGGRGNRARYLYPEDFEAYLQSDDTHLTSEGGLRLGYEYGRMLDRWGVVV